MAATRPAQEVHAAASESSAVPCRSSLPSEAKEHE